MWVLGRLSIPTRYLLPLDFILHVSNAYERTNKHPSKQASKQASKQTCRKASKQANKREPWRAALVLLCGRQDIDPTNAIHLPGDEYHIASLLATTLDDVEKLVGFQPRKACMLSHEKALDTLPLLWCGKRRQSCASGGWQLHMHIIVEPVLHPRGRFGRYSVP